MPTCDGPHHNRAHNARCLALHNTELAGLRDVVEGLEALVPVAVDVDGDHPDQALVHPLPPPGVQMSQPYANEGAQAVTRPVGGRSCL